MTSNFSRTQWHVERTFFLALCVLWKSLLAFFIQEHINSDLFFIAVYILGGSLNFFYVILRSSQCFGCFHWYSLVSQSIPNTMRPFILTGSSCIPLCYMESLSIWPPITYLLGNSILFWLPLTTVQELRMTYIPVLANRLTPHLVFFFSPNNTLVFMFNE